MKTGPTPLDKSSARVGRRRWSRRCSGNAQKAKGKFTSISSANFADAREVGHLCAESRSIHKQVLIVHEEGLWKKLGTSGLHPSMGADCLQGTTEYVAQIQPSNYTKAKNSYREEGGFWQIFWHDIPLLQGRKPAEMLSLTWLPGRWPVLCNSAGNSQTYGESRVGWGGLDWYTEFIRQLCFEETEWKLYRKGHLNSVLQQIHYQVIPMSVSEF